MKASRFLCAAPLLLAACATPGPTASQITRALADAQPPAPAPAVRHIRCSAIDEEPTEFICSWRERDTKGVWRARSGEFAIDGEAVRYIGGFVTTPPPLASGKVVVR